MRGARTEEHQEGAAQMKPCDLPTLSSTALSALSKTVPFAPLPPAAPNGTDMLQKTPQGLHIQYVICEADQKLENLVRKGGGGGGRGGVGERKGGWKEGGWKERDGRGLSDVKGRGKRQEEKVDEHQW